MIIQGSNDGILIKCDDGTKVSKMYDISAVLCIHSTTLVSNKVNIVKHWGWDDVQRNETANTIYLPLSQQETMLLTPGNLTLEWKWLDSSDIVHPMDIASIEISARCDETILEAKK